MKSSLRNTEKCHSFGVRKDERYNSTSMSIVLDDNSVKTFEEIIACCENHLGKPLSNKVLYKRDDGSVAISPKIQTITKFFEGEKKIDSMKYERKICDVKAVLAIEGIILNGEKANLQVKLYDALVYKKVRERVRLVDME